MMRTMLTEARRAYIYRVLLTLQPLIVFYGVASSTAVALWLTTASAVLGLGLATANTSTKKV